MRRFLCGLAAMVLTSCGGGGGGGDTTTTLLDQTTTATGNTTGFPSSIVAVVDGPAFQTTAATTSFTVCLEGTWTQSVQQSVGLTLTLTMLAPVQGPAGTTHTANAATSGATPVAFKQCHTVQSFGAGNRLTQVRFRVDTNCSCTTALRDYTATIRWTVTATQ